MGRPQKNEQDKRTGPPIKILMNKEEREMAKRESELAGLMMTQWARHKLFGSTPDRRKPNPYRASIIKGLADMGRLRTSIEGHVSREVLSKIVTLADKLIEELSDGHTR